MTYTMCPECNRDRETLRLFDNGSQHCHACGYHVTSSILLAQETTRMRLPDGLQPFQWTSKGISDKVLGLYGVHMLPDGKVFFPHYSTEMELLGYQTRTPGNRDFKTYGTVVPIGLHTLTGSGKELVICEGHTDVLAVKTMLHNVDVLGVPGSDTVNCLKPYLSTIRKYRKITICTDADEAGDRCADKLEAILPPAKTRRIHLNRGMDAGDYLVGNLQSDFTETYKLATSKGTSPYVTREHLVQYTLSKSQAIISTGYPSVDKLFGGGLGVGELNVLLGYTGKGKSTLAQAIATNAIKRGVKVLYIAGEMLPEQTVYRLARQHSGHYVDKSNLLEAATPMLDNMYIAILDDFSIQNITTLISDSVTDEGVELVVLDVLSDVDGFISGNHEEPYHVIQALHKAARGSTVDNIPPCALLAVAHTKGNDEGEVELNDMRGGSAIKQCCECVIGVNAPTDLRDTNRTVKLLKLPRNRDHTAITADLEYNQESKMYHEPSITIELPRAKQIPIETRRKLSPEVPTSHTSSTLDIPVRDTKEVSTVPLVTGEPTPSVPTTVEPASESLPPRLPVPTDRSNLRNKGTIETGRQTKTQTSSPTKHQEPFPFSGKQLSEDSLYILDPARTEEQLSHLSRTHKLVLRMYRENPRTLDRHLIFDQNQNKSIRDNLATLGIKHI